VFLISLLASVLLALPANLAPLIYNQDAEIIPDEYLVFFKQDSLTSSGLLDSVLASVGVQESSVLHRYQDGFSAVMDEATLTKIRAMDEVEFVEPNQVVYTHEVQNNPPSWGLARISQRQFRARDIYHYPDTAGEGVDVYIIDTGVNIEHQDFEGRASWGYTAPDGDSDVDGNGHGTHVASTVAGKSYGVAKKANIIAVKVLRSSGYGTTADVVAGIEWANQKASESDNASAANMSLGGGRSMALDRAVAKAIANGLPFAVAAGNSNADACRFSPAAVESAVTVGASTVADSRAYFSNVGQCVDIFAPGNDITGAWIGSTTAKRTISGTSMASPHVAGVMALFLAENKYSATELKQKLIEVATPNAVSGLPANTINLLLHNDVGTELYF